MYRHKNLVLSGAFLLCSANFLLAQGGPQSLKLQYSKGITIQHDSLFQMQVRFRMQERLGFTTMSGVDWSTKTADMRVRRCRLRLEGFVLDKRLRYLFHLGFSKADLDLEATTTTQVIRDAIVYYRPSGDLQIGLGQTKLPGNRQRVISSGDQQFPDLSITNAAFNLDRDFGFFFTDTVRLGSQQLQVKGAWTTGDGRGASPGTGGFAYTGRFDWLPLGAFTNGGDYYEGDLAMEPKPKVSIGGVYSWNDRAARTGGQLGNDLYSARSMSTAIVDLLVKYRGWALSAEGFQRQCSDPITHDLLNNTRFVLTGQGFNGQLSKYFKSKYEIAGRYSLVLPSDQVSALSVRTEETLLGATRYINKHRVKLQTYIGYRWTLGDMALDHPGNNWTTMFQIEFGI
ncbi:MAG TPA: porin [Flavobacteriales bacterium]|nr:porin [Flavobacteriales bacterium]